MKNKTKQMIFGMGLIVSLSFHLAIAAGGSSTVGPANPAAVNCIKLGGELESYQTPEGENSYCVIEEWSLFNQMADRDLVRSHDSLGQFGIPNPAAVNCNNIGGYIRTVNNPYGEAGYCVVDQWDLFRAIDITKE